MTDRNGPPKIEPALAEAGIDTRMTPWDYLDHLQRRHDVEPEKPFELTARPGENPAVHEFLPLDSYVSPPFEGTRYRTRSKWRLELVATNSDTDQSESATIVYAPDGELGDQGRHVACRVRHFPEATRSEDTVERNHDQLVDDATGGMRGPENLSDWATTALEETTVSGYRRTTYTCRLPRLDTEGISESVRRPVQVWGVLVQSVDWGVIETGAFLTPKPDEGRLRELVTDTADTVLSQALQYGPPKPQPAEQERAGAESAPENWPLDDDQE